MLKIFLISILFFLSIQAEEKSSATAFMYHRFAQNTFPSTNITIEQFKAQLDYLEKNNYNIWKFSKIVKYLQDNKKLPKKTVSLTIDDAYISIYNHAYKLLKEKGFDFTVFVNTNPVDNGSKNFMSWEQMRQLQDHGAEFLNHSLSHDYLLQKKGETKEEAKSRIKNEILKAQKRLEEELGKPAIKILAYPFGEYDLQTKKILKELGFIGVSQTSGPLGKYTDLLAIKRFPMSENYAKMPDFILKLNSHEFPIKSTSHISPILVDKNLPTLKIELEKKINNISCFLSSGEKINIKWLDNTSFEVSSSKAIEKRREHYTCTAPAKDGAWYWYSHLFIKQ